jgi:hypothetical protein
MNGLPTEDDPGKSPEGDDPGKSPEGDDPGKSPEGDVRAPLFEQLEQGDARKWSRLRRALLVLQARHAISSLERPPRQREVIPHLLFVAAFAGYYWVSSAIALRNGFKKFNVFFNADCPRVIADILRGHVRVPSKNVATAHPLFALFANPPSIVLEAMLPAGSGNLPARLLCNAAAAGAAALAYRVFRRLDAPRALAVAGAAVYGLSCSEIVLGSIVETFPFVSLTLVASVLIALRTTKPMPNALGQVAAFGMNVSVLPHTLFCAPVLWFPRMRFFAWAKKTSAFLCAVVFITLALAKTQETLYPGTGYFFQKDEEATHEYRRFYAVPRTKDAFLERAHWLVPHFFGFSVVAPRPLLTRPDRFTTFMWEKKGELAEYDVFGSLTAFVWCAAVAVATASNARTLVRGTPIERSRVALFAGWLLGTFGLFTAFGDDLLLYSPLWTFHLVAWVVLGLASLKSRIGRPWLRYPAFVFVAALAANNAVFVYRMLQPYG